MNKYCLLVPAGRLLLIQSVFTRSSWDKDITLDNTALRLETFDFFSLLKKFTNKSHLSIVDTWRRQRLVCQHKVFICFFFMFPQDKMVVFTNQNKYAVWFLMRETVSEREREEFCDWSEAVMTHHKYAPSPPSLFLLHFLQWDAAALCCCSWLEKHGNCWSSWRWSEKGANMCDLFGLLQRPCHTEMRP